MTGNSSNARVFLAREIQRARQAKGMSQDALAKNLFVSKGHVQHWEQGRRVPSVDDLEKLDDLFDLNGVLVRFREEFVRAAVPLEWFGRWLEIEKRATSLWTFEVNVIPGLLQTEGYARAILRAGEHDADVEEMVAARIERQRTLTREDGAPTFVALIAEAALRNNIGGSKVMVDQLEHLGGVAEEDNKIIIQIIPASARVCARFTGPFVIAAFNGGDVAYLSNALSSEVIEDIEGMVRLRRMFDVYRAETLRQDESITFIARVVEEWKKQR